MTFTHEAKAKFDVASWSETVLSDIDGEGTTMGEAYYPRRGFTRAEVSYRFTGDLEGTGSLTYLIAYHEGAAPVLGFERFEGSIDGHEGTCVFRHTGVQDTGSVTDHVEVVAGMGTGGLEALRGEAEVRIAGHSEDGYDFVLAYDLG